LKKGGTDGRTAIAGKEGREEGRKEEQREEQKEGQLLKEERKDGY
jgi:hypothetical protein